MKSPLVSVSTMALVAFLLVGCSQAAAPASPTAAPAAPQAAAPQPTLAQFSIPTAAPAKAAAPQPTSAPAKTSTFPEKGKTITVINPWAAGGSTDVGARLLFSIVEKELGVSVQVVNKTGASGQVGITALAQSQPDGYTIGYSNFPAAINNYLDPDRDVTYTGKDLQPLAMQVMDPGVITVTSSSPYKTLKDFVDAAKAKPDTIKIGDTGIGGDDHVAVLLVERLTGARFKLVHFDGGAPAEAALRGGHIDAVVGNVGDWAARIKGGDINVLGVMDYEETKFLPGVKTFEAQGIKLYSYAPRGVSVRAGTPKDIVDVLAGAIQKAVNSDEHLTKMEQQGLTVRYRTPEEYAAYWAETETLMKELMPMIKQER